MSAMLTIKPVQTCAGGARQPVISGLFLVAAAAVLLAETLVQGDRPTVAVVWGGVALAAYVAGLLCFTSAVRSDGLGLAAWKIGPWTLLWYGVAFGAATITWSQPQYGVAAEIGVPSILRALWLVAAGMTAWAVGYCISPAAPLRRLAARPVMWLEARRGSEIRSPAAPWLLYAVGTAARLITVAATGRLGYVTGGAPITGGATGYGGILGAFSLCAPLAVAAAALRVFREGRRDARMTLVLLLAAEVAVGALSGQKENFVVAVLAVVIPFSAARRRIPRKSLAVLALVFLAVVIPFNQAYRSAVRGASTLTPREAVTAAPGILAASYAGRSAGGVLPSALRYLAQRVREIDNVAVVMQRTPAQVPYLSPLQLAEAPVVNWVPRAIWAGKPVLDTGLTFSRVFYEIPLSTSSADTVPGGLYWHGGWIPVLVGMLLLGLAVRLLDGALDARASPHAILLVLLLLPLMAGGEEDLGSILGSLPATVFTWIAATLIVFRPRSQETRSAEEHRSLGVKSYSL